MYKYPILCNVHVLIRVKPYMTVNARPLIIPTFVLRSIHPHGQYILSVKPYIIRNIKFKSAVAAGIPTQVKTVDPNLAVPEDPVKTYYPSPAAVSWGQGKMFAIPSDTGTEIKTSHR